MKSPRKPPGKEQRSFNAWVEHMPASIEHLQAVLAPEIAGRLDFSPASLEVLEDYLLRKFPTFESFDEALTVEWDCYGRYVGEVFRRALGGQWELYWNKPNDVHHNRPVIMGYSGQQVALDPHGLAHVLLDRRTGTFLSGVLEKQWELRSISANHVAVPPEDNPL